MKVYFVRHGESVGNAGGLHQTAEMPLSADGVYQAKKIGERLKKFKINLIIVSPLARTKQTAELISESIGAPFEEWDELIEVKGPTEAKGKLYSDPEVQKIKKLIRENYVKGNWKYSDEENYEEINARAEKLLKRLIKLHLDRNIVCVSHATYIKFLIAKMVFGDSLTPEISNNFYHHFLMHNAGLTICEYGKESGWLIRHVNDVSHL